MATGRGGVNFSTAPPFSPRRVAILNGTTSDAVLRICQGQGLLQHNFTKGFREGVKRVLGNTVYDSLRGLIVRERVR